MFLVNAPMYLNILPNNPGCIDMYADTNPMIVLCVIIDVSIVVYSIVSFDMSFFIGDAGLNNINAFAFGAYICLSV